MKLRAVVNKLRQALCISTAALMLCSGVMFGWGSVALAGERAASAVQARAEQELDRVAGSGTANQIEGQVKEGVGKVQRQVDKTTSQVDGAAKQAAGRAQKDIGRTQEAVEDAADTAQDSAEGIVDSVKDFFGQ
ncbi:MAG: CsbD family protein [Leptolyngbyaceae cyanobacterium]